MNEAEERKIIVELWHEALRLPGIADEPLPKAVSIYDALAELRLRIGGILLITEAQRREIYVLKHAEGG